MTAAQRSCLRTLCTEAGESFDEGEALTKAEAARRIEELQERMGRGQGGRIWPRPRGLRPAGPRADGC